jgi:hypothetical protein
MLGQGRRQNLRSKFRQILEARDAVSAVSEISMVTRNGVLMKVKCERWLYFPSFP